MPTTTRQLAKLAGISEQSARNYSRDYADLLSPQARGEAGPRLFDDEDVQTLCTIAALRRENVPRAEIIARLRQGDIVVEATPSPQHATPNATDAPHAPLATQVALSTIQRQIDAIQRNQTTLLRAAVLWGALWGAIAAWAARPTCATATRSSRRATERDRKSVV